MLQYKNVWGGGNDPVPSIRNDFEYAKYTLGLPRPELGSKPRHDDEALGSPMVSWRKHQRTDPPVFPRR